MGDSSAENSKKSPLTLKQQKFVALYVGAANGNATEACRLAGYAGDANTLAVLGFHNLRNHKIAAEIRQAESQIERRGIAIKQERINAKVQRWQALNAIRVARANAFRQIIEEDVRLPETRRRPVPPGWESGLHVRQVKAIPNGRGGTEIIQEFALDATMLRELDTLEKETAQEQGELETRVGVRHSGIVQHDHRYAGHDDLDLMTVEELEDQRRLRASLDARRMDA